MQHFQWKSSNFLDIPKNVALWVSKSSNFSHIPTNVAIWFSKYSNSADGPRYVAFHNPGPALESRMHAIFQKKGKKCLKNGKKMEK